MGFYARNTVNLTPKTVNDIHKRGGTILGSSRGGHDTTKIVDNIQDRGINQACLCLNFFLFNYHNIWEYHIRLILISLNGSQVYIIGGDGTQKGASLIFEVSTILNN